MIIIIGLVILIAAVVAAVAGVLANSGHAHALTHGFALFGYHVTGSTGTLFLYGIVIGAIGVAGLSLLLAGARRTSRRGREARRGLKQSQQETATVAQARDDLIDQRDTASPLGRGATGTSSGPRSRRGTSRRRLFGRRPADSAESPAQVESPASQPGSDVPAQEPTPVTANGSQP